MDNPMLNQALRTAYGPLGDFAKKVAKDPERWDIAFKKFLRGENPWAKDADAKKETFEFKYSTLVEGYNPFVVRDHFKVDMSPTAEVKIGSLGKNFKKHFLSVVEENVKSTALVRFLIHSCYIPRVFWELGERHEVKLSHLWEALRKQRNGDDTEGVLSTHGSNYLFIFDGNGSLWTVHVRRGFRFINRWSRWSKWVNDGWSIDAAPFCRDVFPNPDYFSAHVISCVK